MSEYMIDRYEAFKERFGAAGVILGVIAIVLAVGGSAIAASGLNGKQKKEVKAIAKSFAGKPGVPGAAGTAGTNGTNGKDGAPGAPGANGKSVALLNEEPPSCPEEEGFTYEIEGSGEEDEVCNGAEGSPWSAGGKLPSGATETGAFSPPEVPLVYAEFPIPGMMEEGQYMIPVSFPIPLSSAPEFVSVPAEGEEFGSDEEGGCPGVVGGIPQAESGKFCVYLTGESEELGLGAPGASVSAFRPDVPVFVVPATAGASRAGAMLQLTCEETYCIGAGLWAVTG
jgi:hypothetical protein